MWQHQALSSMDGYLKLIRTHIPGGVNKCCSLWEVVVMQFFDPMLYIALLLGVSLDE